MPEGACLRACPRARASTRGLSHPCAREIPAVEKNRRAPLSIHSLLRLFVKPSLARRYHSVFIAVLFAPFFRRLALCVCGKPVHQPFAFCFAYLLRTVYEFHKEVGPVVMPR